MKGDGSRQPEAPVHRYTFPGALGGTVRFKYGAVPTDRVDHVLAVARCGRLWLFTRHRQRGLELPGGKLLPGEDPESGMARELYEETGAIVWRQPRAIARYRVEPDPASEPVFVKLVFAVELGVMLDMPAGGDGAGRELLVPPPPEAVSASPVFSPLLKDGVYRILYEHLAFSGETDCGPPGKPQGSGFHGPP